MFLRGLTLMPFTWIFVTFYCLPKSFLSIISEVFISPGRWSFICRKPLNPLFESLKSFGGRRVGFIESPLEKVGMWPPMVWTLKNAGFNKWFSMIRWGGWIGANLASASVCRKVGELYMIMQKLGAPLAMRRVDFPPHLAWPCIPSISISIYLFIAVSWMNLLRRH